MLYKGYAFCVHFVHKFADFRWCSFFLYICYLTEGRARLLFCSIACFGLSAWRIPPWGREIERADYFNIWLLFHYYESFHFKTGIFIFVKTLLNYSLFESGSFRPLSRSPLSRFAHFPFRPESFRPRVVSPTFPFAPESFRPLIKFYF